ncbi:hypothetical protein ACP4OV_003876 [Aristida adscensionis]
MRTTLSSAAPPFQPAARGGMVARCVTQPRARARGDVEHFVVVDFEATCEGGGARIYPQEIIEFPAVLVDAATGRLLSEFRAYVRPRHHPRLTAFCAELTGIRQEQVDAGVGLDEALAMHDAWLAAAGADTTGGGRLAVVTWGDWDCRKMLESECRFKGIAKPAYFDRWVNLRVPFEAAFGAGRRRTLEGAVGEAGLPWEGRAHCGLDDARNTARLLAELMRRGVDIAITGSLAPPQPAAAAARASHPEPPLSKTPPQMVAVGLCSCSCGGGGGGVGVGAATCYCGVAATGGVMMPGPGPGRLQAARLFYGCRGWTPAFVAMCPSPGGLHASS